MTLNVITFSKASISLRIENQIIVGAHKYHFFGTDSEISNTMPSN